MDLRMTPGHPIPGIDDPAPFFRSMALVGFLGAAIGAHFL
jgi:hypothetical protein